MSSSDVKAIHARIVERLDGQDEIDLDGFASLMRHLLFDISDSTIGQFFDQIDRDGVGTIDTKLLTQDAEFAKRVLTALDENTNQTVTEDEIIESDYKSQPPSRMVSNTSGLDINPLSIRVTSVDKSDAFVKSNSLSTRSIDSPFATDKETDIVIAHLERELAQLKSWKLEFGDPAITQVKELREQVKVYQSDEADLESKIADMKEKLAQELDVENDFKNEFDVLVAAHAGVTEELAALNKNFDLKKQECEELTKSVSSLETQLSSLQQSYQDLTQINAEFERQNKNYKVEMNKKREEKSKLTQENNQLKAEMTRKGAQHNQQINALESELNQLKEQIQAQQAVLTNNAPPLGPTSPNAAGHGNQTIRYEHVGKGNKSMALGNQSFAFQALAGTSYASNAIGGASNVSNTDFAGYLGLHGTDASGVIDENDFEIEIRREIEMELTQKMHAQMQTKMRAQKDMIRHDLIGFETKCLKVLKQMEEIASGSEKRIDGMKVNVDAVEKQLKRKEQRLKRKKKAKKEKVNSEDEGDETKKLLGRQTSGVNVEFGQDTNTCVVFGWGVF